MNKIITFLFRFLAVLVLIAVILTIYLLFARPYQLTWGATQDEIHRSMPGDELNPDPKFLATRAITIKGRPEEIYPWLLQMGYGRAGFYGYDILENIGSPNGIRSANLILPTYQHFKPGDDAPLSAAGGLVFYAIEPDKYLVWSGAKGWGGITWALYPIDETHTRLVSRVRFSHNLTSPSQLTMDLFTEFSDPLAVRKILQGIKGRVEGQVEPMAQGNIEFAIYLTAALLFVISIVLILIRPLTWQRWLAGLVTGAAWLFIWYSRAPFWVGFLVEILVIWYLYRSFRNVSSGTQVISLDAFIANES